MVRKVCMCMVQFLKNVIRFLKKVFVFIAPVFLLFFLVICIVCYYEPESLPFYRITPFIVVSSFLLGALYNHCSRGDQA